MSRTEERTILDVADQLFGAIEQSDTALIEQLWDDDIAVWHSGDPKDNDYRRAYAVICWFIDRTSTRRYEVIDRRAFSGGFVQQHILHAVGTDGVAIALRVCIMVLVGSDGRITRIDEYFDPADMAPLL